MPQAIFFDLDETLIRHSTPIMEQLQAVCHQHLADLSETRWNIFHEHLMSNVGQLWRDIAEYQGRCEAEFIAIFRSGLQQAGGDTALAKSMIESFLDSVVKSTGPTEGAHEVLDRLAAAGIATGIITNGFAFLQKRKVKAHGLAERVQFVMTSEDAGAHKPDARIFLMAMDQVGADAAGCWHVGDHRDNDVAGAIAAGLGAVLYDPDRLVADGPDAASLHSHQNPAPYRVIRQLSEMMNLIGR
jgi:putative hydrolase of the HAD superfamily